MAPGHSVESSGLLPLLTYALSDGNKGSTQQDSLIPLFARLAPHVRTIPPKHRRDLLSIYTDYYTHTVVNCNARRAARGRYIVSTAGLSPSHDMGRLQRLLVHIHGRGP